MHGARREPAGRGPSRPVSLGPTVVNSAALIRRTAAIAATDRPALPRRIPGSSPTPVPLTEPAEPSPRFFEPTTQDTDIDEERTVTRTSSARLFAAGGSLATQPANQDADVFRLALPDDLVTALTDRRFILRKPLLHQGLLIPEVADHYCRAVGDLPGAEDVRSTAQALLVNPDGEGLLVLETGTLLDACELSQALTLLTAVLSMVSRPLRAFAQWPLWKPLGTNLSIDPMRATGTGYNPLHLDIVNSTRPPDHSVLLCVRPDPLGGGHSLVSQVRRGPCATGPRRCRSATGPGL